MGDTFVNGRKMDSNYNDLLAHYKRFKGDVDRIRECMVGNSCPREDHDRTSDQAVDGENIADCKVFIDPRKRHHRRMQLKCRSSGVNSDASITCAVCRDAGASFRHGAIVCGSCDLFFSRYSHYQTVRQSTHERQLPVIWKCKQRGLQSGSCIVDYTCRSSCRSCRLKKCIEAGMRKPIPQHVDPEARKKRLMRREEKAAKREDEKMKAPMQLELISQRNHRTRLSYVTAVIKTVVRKSTSTEIGKLLIAVKSGDQDTECVAFPHETITVGSCEAPSHVYVLRAFRWNRINRTSVFSSNPCSVGSGCVCINPYHYDRVKTKKPMGKICVVANCKSYTDGPDHFSFHVVPNKTTDVQRYRYFLTACARRDLEVTGFTNSHRICSRHFLESDFIVKNGKKRLKKTSLPSQYLGRQIYPVADCLELLPCTDEEIYEVKNRRLSDGILSSGCDDEEVNESKEYEFWNELQSADYEHVEDRPEWRRIHRSDTAVGFGRIRMLDSLKVAVDTVFIFPTFSVVIATDNHELPVDVVHDTIGQDKVMDGSMLQRLCDLDYGEISRQQSRASSLGVERSC